MNYFFSIKTDKIKSKLTIPKFQNSSIYAWSGADVILLKYYAMYGLFSTMLTLADGHERTR